MKSIMQEASSISKAIEQGWIKAGRPQEFSIKILEEPQTNLMGLITTRSAKIALFFDEKIVTTKIQPEIKIKQPIQQPRRQPMPRETRQPQQMQEQTERREQQPQESRPQPQQRQVQQRGMQPLWTESMVKFSQNWFSETLKALDLSNISFTIEPQNFHLRITLSEPILRNPDKEKHLLASFSAIMFETLRKQFKTSLRGHKIVLTHSYST